MHFISANNDVSKVIFNPREEELALGDFIRFGLEHNRFIISVVTKTKSIKENDKYNLAIAKNILTVDEDVLESWSGQIPAPKSKVEKMPLSELISLINNPLKSVILGQNKQENVYSSLEALKQNTFILADNQSDKVEFNKSLLNELLKNNQKVILFDFLGEYNFNQEVPRVVAGKDFKLLLNSNTIDAIYEQGLKDALIETRAVIEDVFAEVKSYLNEDENNFVPFESFKQVIASETSIPQLTVLKNQLEKYSEQNIFANEKAEFDIVKESIEKSNFLIVDLSTISSNWLKEYFQSVMALSFNTPVFTLFDIKEGLIKEDCLNKLISNKQETNIYPIVSLGYSSKLVEFASYLAKNLFLFNPNILIKNFPEYSTFLANLGKSEFISIAEELNNIPFKLKINKVDILADFSCENEVQEETIEGDIPEVTVDNLFEVPEVEPPVQEVEEVNQIVISSEVLEEVIEEVEPEVSDSDEFIEFDEDDDFDFDELDLDELDAGDILDEEIEEPSQVEVSPSQEEYIQEDDDFELIEEDEVAQEISGEVESLYTAPKEQQEEFTNNSLPIYQAPVEEASVSSDIKEGDDVSHQKYGIGSVKKIINYGDKTLLSIQFDRAGRRLLDPNLAGLEKINAG